MVVVVMKRENDENDHNGPQKASAKSFPVAQTSKISFSKHVLGSRLIAGSVKGLHCYDPSCGRFVSAARFFFATPISGTFVLKGFLRYLIDHSFKWSISISEHDASKICCRIATEFTLIGAVVKKLLAVAQITPPPPRANTAT